MEEEEAEAKAREMRLNSDDGVVSSAAFSESISKEDLLRLVSSENQICLLFLCYIIILRDNYTLPTYGLPLI